MKYIYLDYAAATPMDPRVLKAMEPYFSDKFHNPSSTYAPARETKAALEEARKTVAAFLGAKHTEITFTAGGTEANNLAIIGTATKYPGAHIITTATEHDSVLKPIQYLGQNGWETSFIKPEKDGRVDPDKLLEAVTDETVLLSVIYANNEVGTIQPLSKIAAGLAGIRRARAKRGIERPLYLHTDACQATQYLDMHASRLGVDMLSFNSDKIHGPKQYGALFISSGTMLNPLIFGGDQERGLRSGTPNVPAAAGFARAIEIVGQIKPTEPDRVRKLRDILHDEVLKIDGATVNGTMKKRLPNNLHVTFPGVDNERLLLELEEHRIIAASGAACSASSEEPSHVLRSMGLSDELIRSSMRFSLGRETTEEDIKQTVKTLRELVG
ncbi:MAG TPA: cysteine desulfurase family protein [Candidatus Saccharimonadales bacterium]|nr:cysteine desulfurase family protein [Candidatus Saccharimonadales bacterium]